MGTSISSYMPQPRASSEYSSGLYGVTVEAPRGCWSEWLVVPHGYVPYAMDEGISPGAGGDCLFVETGLPDDNRGAALIRTEAVHRCTHIPRKLPE
jgi:hypothetical protein